MCAVHVPRSRSARVLLHICLFDPFRRGIRGASGVGVCRKKRDEPDGNISTFNVLAQSTATASCGGFGEVGGVVCTHLVHTNTRLAPFGNDTWTRKSMSLSLSRALESAAERTGDFLPPYLASYILGGEHWERANSIA